MDHFYAKENWKVQIRHILQYSPVYLVHRTCFCWKPLQEQEVFLRTVFKKAFHRALCLSRCICHQLPRKASTCWALQAACAHEHRFPLSLATLIQSQSYLLLLFSLREELTRQSALLPVCRRHEWQKPAFQQDSIFIVTCWNHFCANKTGNLLKEKILLKIVSALISTLTHFLYLHLDKIKRFTLFTSGENKNNPFCMWM